MSPERPDPLAYPVTRPPATKAAEQPCCPEHGLTRLKSQGCGYLCQCYPPQWRCLGFDGEWCPFTRGLTGEQSAALPAVAEAILREGGFLSPQDAFKLTCLGVRN